MVMLLPLVMFMDQQGVVTISDSDFNLGVGGLMGTALRHISGIYNPKCLGE